MTIGGCLSRACVAASLVLALLSFAAGAAAQGAERRIALVIGESHYDNVPALPNTGNDARLIAETLKRLGFELVGGKALTDLGKAEFEKAIRNFGDQAPNSVAALFYYAGHGIQIGGVNYLVPTDANPQRPADADFELVDTSVVLRQMEGSGARLKLVILDACRNNPFGGRGLRGGGGGLAKIKAPTGTLISYATQPDNVAFDGTAGGDSPYTIALAQAMKQPGRSVFQVFNDVGVAVDRATAGVQQPWISISPIDGEFYFAGATPQAAASVGPKQMERAFWDSVKDSSDPAMLRAYLDKYPGGEFASRAQSRIAMLATAPKMRSPAGQPGPFDGVWRGVMECGPTNQSGPYSGRGFAITVRGGNIAGKRHGQGQFFVNGAHVTLEQNVVFDGTIDPNGAVSLDGRGATKGGEVSWGAHYAGTAKNGKLDVDGVEGSRKCSLHYQRQ